MNQSWKCLLKAVSALMSLHFPCCNLLCTLSSLSKLNDDDDDDDDGQRKPRKILPHHSLVLVARKLHGDTEKHLNVVLGIHTLCLKNVPPLQLAIIFTYTVRLRQFLA